MIVKNTGAKYSSIVSIGEKIKELEETTGDEYLKLNRGINMVVDMDLNDLIFKHIDFNDKKLQIYPPNNGFKELRHAINVDYFDGNGNDDNVFITNGGMSGLDIIMKTLDVKKIITPEYFWGAYKNIIKINGLNQETYKNDYGDILDNTENFKDGAVIICDPNNPLGDKVPDDKLIRVITKLSESNIPVIFDGPYRKLFITENDFYIKLLDMDNVIINESFSKRYGLSGQRIGFVHSTDKIFNKTFNINLLYSTNGINVFSQVLIDKLLSTDDGKIVSEKFRKTTSENIKMNIDYLKTNKILADDFYKDDTVPMGIFVVINIPHDKLMDNRVGSVSLSFFTNNKNINKNYSRICVSVEHKKFVKYFKNIK